MYIKKFIFVLLIAKTQFGFCDSLNIIFGNNEINVDVEIVLNTNPCIIWKAITDYENLEKFHTNVKKSELRDVKGNNFILYQVFKTYFLEIPFTLHSLFLVKEFPKKFNLEINLIEGDFKKYYSIWKIERTNNTKLNIKTNISVSNFKKIFLSKKKLETQYEQFIYDLKNQLKHQKYENFCSNKY